MEGKDDKVKLQELYGKIREDRATCDDCMKHEANFAWKLVEYQWRREICKYGHDPFESLLSALRAHNPI